ncbi:MAG: ABC transporter ATP-binding protein [Actinobacteria bacterium]|nr:ABC transporter ATP-binding protein [Actinomycetota bacterium]
MTGAPLLAVDGLVKHFPVHGDAYGGGSDRVVHAVDGVSFTIGRGETLALVGESGCGKSTVARLVLRLLDATAGSITFDGVDVTGLAGKQLRDVRRRVQVVFQDPFSSFDPRRRVGDSVAEPLVAQGRKRDAPARVPELLELVGLDAAAAGRFPHEFSGGQRQRLAIARALSVQPDLVVLDEPVSALDVSIQAQVLTLLADLRTRFGLAYLFISHDLAVVRNVADRVAVMHLGHIVETGPTAAVFADPIHPYTRALLSAVPDPDPVRERTRERIVLAGDPPSPIDPPSGCRFRTRCALALDSCAASEPPLVHRGDGPSVGHLVACPVVLGAAPPPSPSM